MQLPCHDSPTVDRELAQARAAAMSRASQCQPCQDSLSQANKPPVFTSFPSQHIRHCLICSVPPCKTYIPAGVAWHACLVGHSRALALQLVLQAEGVGGALEGAGARGDGQLARRTCNANRVMQAHTYREKFVHTVPADAGATMRLAAVGGVCMVVCVLG